MNLSVNLLRRGALGAALAAAMLLASCGGGDPVVAFVPDRVLAFGDEDSLITDEGRKYTVNALEADTSVIDCATHAIWVQRLASSYGLVFPQCKGDAADPRSRIYAAAQAKVADLAAQVDQHLAADTFSAKDLVTLMAGRNDVLEQYRAFDAGGSKAAALDAVYASGQVLAVQVSRIAAEGGKVLVSTVPDIGLSPYALNENTTSGDSTRAVFISQLVAKFNEGLRVGIQNETGDQVALMLTDELVQTMVRFPASYGGMTNVTSAVCDPAQAATVDLCTTDTLVTDGSAVRYLWADDTHLSPNGHAYIGSLASSRTRANPF